MFYLKKNQTNIFLVVFDDFDVLVLKIKKYFYIFLNIKYFSKVLYTTISNIH